jgi:hydroxypyruvate reductase
VIGSGRLSARAAERAARRVGYRTLVLTTGLAGEAREAARVLAAILGDCQRHGRPLRPPACLLAAGETTVTVRGDGRGGRNQELALAAAVELARFAAPAVVGTLATDGRDGRSDAAGAVVDDTTCARGARRGLPDPLASLARNDSASASYLARVGDQLVTGPSGTNVADVVICLTAGRRNPRQDRSLRTL